MKTDWTHLEPYRLISGNLGSSPGDTFGFFIFKDGKRQIRAMACDGEETGWEHVSVSIMYRNNAGKVSMVMPTWEDMCRVKDLFWEDTEAVVQFHPPRSEYVNNHAACLHLWKWVGGDMPLPPSELVGIKEAGTLT